MKYAEHYCSRLLHMTRIMIEFTRDHPGMPNAKIVRHVKEIIAREVYP